MSQSVYKILLPKIIPWLQNKNVPRKEKTELTFDEVSFQ